ncbi:uncharacterized protein LOC143182443 [Calliopsis andreniformis]|uniref:uncharacterized protein LOC143182443 n=1 Tax=Calliopsis andreniformis TaxID=337506 RepID=UPI003FCCC51A
MNIDKVVDLMDQMMKMDIFRPSEKLRMLKDEEKTFLDPNLIMDARHRIFCENLPVSPTKNSVLAEARRLLSQEEAKELYMKKQQRFLERELKKFEMELRKSRPKFLKHYTCKKRNLAPSHDDEFWETSRKIKNKVGVTSKVKTVKSDSSSDKDIRSLWKSVVAKVEDLSLKVENEKEPRKTDCEMPYIGNIKVTIKDKPNLESETQRLDVLRKCFDTLKENAKEESRLRDIKTNIQRNMNSRIMKKYFDIWKRCTKCMEDVQQEQKEEKEISEEQRIEMFINTITERQRELMRSRKPKTRDANLIVKEPNRAEMKRRRVYSKPILVESPAQCRLNAQKQIIEKQRAKLAEQNKMIEELKLKQVQEEILRANKETVNIAKETLIHCGQKTRRTLIQLMQQAGHRNESLTTSQRIPDPPKFLLRMEARAEARRKRIKLAEESRRKKLEEQKKREEVARIEEEQTKRRLRQEAFMETRRLRREQEQNRLREIEKFRKLNSLADDFYRKYLLRHYVMEPLIALIEQKKNNIKKAENHYNENLMRKIFVAWKNETKTQCELKNEISNFFYSKKLMAKIFEKWKQMTKETNLKLQVAIDFCDMKVLDKYFKMWQIRTLELKAENKKKETLSNGYYESKLKVKFFCMWKKYLTVAGKIRESEKRKNELRQLVQKVIPDFDPKQRGVALDD